MDEELRKKRKCAFESLQEKIKRVKLTLEEEAIMNVLTQLYTSVYEDTIPDKDSKVYDNTQNLGRVPEIQQIMEHKEANEEGSSIIQVLTEAYRGKRDAIEQIKFGEASIRILPSLLSPNSIHSRFQPKQGSQLVCFLKTQLYNDIKEKLEALQNKDGSSLGDVLFLYGEVGIGKSFGMALNVLEKRSSWKECPYLIFYLHNQDKNSYINVFQEFLYSLCFVNMTKQEEGAISEELLKIFKADQKKSVQEQVEHIKQTAQFDSLDVTKFRDLLRIMNLLKKHILLVIDQAPVNTQQKMKSLSDIVPNLMSQYVNGCTLLIFSSQLPPQIYARDETFQENIKRLSGKFSTEEVELYLKHHISSKFWDSDTQTFTKSIERIKTVCERIPYELSRLCDYSFGNSITSEEEVIKQYYEGRKKELQDSYSKVSTQLRTGRWIEFLANTFLGIRFRIKQTDENSIDQNLCGFDLKEEEHYELKFHSELYSEWIMEYEMPAISKHFDDNNLADHIQSLSVAGIKGTTKGDILEKCCILYLCNLACSPSKNIWTFTYYKSSLTAASLSVSFKIINYLIFRVRSHTIGDSLLKYSQHPGNEGQSQTNAFAGTLFIPNAENFQGLDVIFMCAKQKRIFLFQYALNIMAHKSSDVDLYADLNDQKKVISEDSCYGNLIKGLRKLKNQGFTVHFIWFGLLDGTNGSYKKLANSAEKQAIISNMKKRDPNSLFVLLDEQKDFQHLSSICGS